MLLYRSLVFNKIIIQLSQLGVEMSEFCGRNPYMDYRNVVPFMDLSGFIVKQPDFMEDQPAASLKERLFRKKFSNMINRRRLRYCAMCEVYRNGRK